MEDDGGGVAEWELGLPSSADLTPLCHQLIPPELASAFSISPEPYRNYADVDRASYDTISAIRGQGSESDGPDPFETRPIGHQEPLDPFKTQQIDDEETDTADDVAKAAELKRPRLVWTPQLHKRFVDVVSHLGLKNAVPKTIMQMMNVEGLTRENVASHLQKYRLYLKRMCHDEGPSESESGGGGHVAMPMMMQVPMVPSHGGFPWLQQQREAFGSVGSFRHHRRRHAGSNDE